MKWPADRTFVDTQRKIVDPWLGPLKRIEPLLPFLTPENITSLKALVQAFRDAEESPEDEGNVFDLPIDDEPLFSEDFLISWETARSEARRVPMSHFVGKPELISTTVLSGLSTVSIDIPLGYTNVEIVVKGLSQSGAGTSSVAFSEDGGGTFVTQSYNLYNNAGGFNGSGAGNALWEVGSFVAASARFGRMMIYDYAGSIDKYVFDHGFGTSDNAGWTAHRVLTSTGPINRVRFTSFLLTTYDAGTIELWGLP